MVMSLTLKDLQQIKHILQPEFEGVNKSIDRVEKRLSQVEQGLSLLEQRLGRVEQSGIELETKIEEVQQVLSARLDQMETDMINSIVGELMPTLDEQEIRLARVEKIVIKN